MSKNTSPNTLLKLLTQIYFSCSMVTVLTTTDAVPNNTEGKQKKEWTLASSEPEDTIQQCPQL